MGVRKVYNSETFSQNSNVINLRCKLADQTIEETKVNAIITNYMNAVPVNNYSIHIGDTEDEVLVIDSKNPPYVL